MKDVLYIVGILFLCIGLFAFFSQAACYEPGGLVKTNPLWCR